MSQSSKINTGMNDARVFSSGNLSHQSNTHTTAYLQMINTSQSTSEYKPSHESNQKLLRGTIDDGSDRLDFKFDEQHYSNQVNML